MPTPHWYTDPKAWQEVRLGGLLLPGLCDVEDIKLASKWDIKEAPGTDGATETYKGYTPASLSIRVRLWEPTHWERWQLLFPTLRPRPGKATPKPFDITHPATAAVGIKSVIVTEIAGPTPGDPEGVMEFVLTCREFFPAPKKNVTGTATSSAAGRNPPGDDARPIDSQKTETPKPPSKLRPSPPLGATEDTEVFIIGDSL